MKTNFTIATAAVSLLAVMMMATGCKKPKKVVPPTVVVVESSVVVSYNKAWMIADVTEDGGGEIWQRGFCYGKMGETPDTILYTGSNNPFSVELPNLSPSTIYTCRAFAGNEAGRGYSDLFRFTTMSDTIPLVDTYVVKNITYCSATPSGQVLSNGGQEVMERGICYSTESLPTVEGAHVAAGSGVGPFECELRDLSPETRYYVRAYAICTKGVYYGDQLNFDTKVLPLAVRTVSVSDITASRVKAKGEVIRDGGYEVTERGFCWGTEHHPTIEGLHIKAGVGLGMYSYYFSGLERGQTHYVRAYAINEDGVAYGGEIEFVPDDSFMSWPNGTSPGLFSVGEGRQVRFSQGNLQYCPDDDRWRFAERQWDYVGGKLYDNQLGDMDFGTVYANGAKCDNLLMGRYYDGWMDLFCWGTSGWDNGNLYYHPYDYASRVHNYFGPVGNFDLTGEYAQADWGVYNTISNGGSRQWRTPSAEEINYLLLERRTSSGIRYAKAVVAGVRGLIVLPDDWNASTYSLMAFNVNGSYTVNIITGEEWIEVLDPAGAVFLPSAGYTMSDFKPSGMTELYYMGNSESSNYDCDGSYWTTTCAEESVNEATYLLLWGSTATRFLYTSLRCNGYSVRLISDERMNY